MHVTILTSEYTPFIRGGLGTHVVNLSKALVAKVQISVANWGVREHAGLPVSRDENGVEVIMICRIHTG